ncbi:Detected protein of unknown function [Hibiscus syriacus]|uniref:Uncharacterized protein n=1 Tax=Hibiscus syriacus TaxID=106335 RepID=A0A6A2Y091_HIBSY|nr:Detected protein of unknown function [Hibiscus syriacus]
MNVEEFVAHATNVNCRMGKKTCRVLITGGDDHKVNIWSIGKPSSLMSLCGHTSPVESLAFDSAEVLVHAGSSTGGIKLWDLEETKSLGYQKEGMHSSYKGHTRGDSMIRFTPDGRWVVSGGFDNVVKVWDLTAGKLLNEFKFHEGIFAP